MRFPRVFLVWPVLCAGFIQAQTSAATVDLKEVATYSIPLLNGQNAARGKGAAYIRIQLNGREPERVLVDTGSVGLILPADELGHPSGTPGFIRYSSSGIGYKGVWTKQRILIPDAVAGNLLAKEIPGIEKGAAAEIEVFSAEERTCEEGTPHSNCDEVMKRPISVHMLGIGFGRSAATATPERNLLLQLDAMTSGRMQRGYLFRRNEQLIVGNLSSVLAPRNNMCQSVKLQPFAAHKGDWQTPPAEITINGQRFEGTALIDTGISDSLVAADGFPETGTLAPGTTVDVNLKGTSYGAHFTIGKDAVPATAHWVKHTHGAYVNTGYGPLASLDYFFNATTGEAGFCRR